MPRVVEATFSINSPSPNIFSTIIQHHVAITTLRDLTLTATITTPIRREHYAMNLESTCRELKIDVKILDKLADTADNAAFECSALFLVLPHQLDAQYLFEDKWFAQYASTAALRFPVKKRADVYRTLLTFTREHYATSFTHYLAEHIAEAEALADV